MAFEEINKDNTFRVDGSILSYLGITKQDIADTIAEWDLDMAKEQQEDTDKPQSVPEDELTYKEHVDAVERRAVDLDNTSMGDKIKLLVDDTLNRLLTGEIVIENAQELIATIQAVDSAVAVADRAAHFHV